MLSAKVMPDLLNAFALKVFRPFFNDVVVHVTVVLAVLQTMFLRVAPRT